MAEKETDPTIREIRILTCFSLGFGYIETAIECGLTLGQVKHSLAIVCAKLEARNVTHAIAVALRRGLID